MGTNSTRRSFLQIAVGTAAAADWLLGTELPRVSAAEANPPGGNAASLTPNSAKDVAPLVRLIEETPREKLVEEVVQRIRRGTSYREIVAALMLAGVRNIQPRPNVGFKFHAVLVVNSAHLASLSSPDEHRWLPILWAIDYFKDAQAQNVREGNWSLPAVDESRVPAAHKAREMFVEAMDGWDEAKADVAAAALARSASSGELFELFCRYGARDYRSIGHKAIFVANAWRTLQCVGWQYAEQVLRSLTYALLNHNGEANPADNDFAADRPFRENLQRLARFRGDWASGKVDSGATSDLLDALHGCSASEASQFVEDFIDRGVAVQSIWDALLLQGAELLRRQPGIIGIHTLTTANALRYAYGAANSDATRQLLLLQAAAFLAMFRDSMRGRGAVADSRLRDLNAGGSLPDAEPDALELIFSNIEADRERAAQMTLAYAERQPDPAAFMRLARVLVFLKGRDSHDYKFSSAVLEDFHHLSPDWRPRFLAASVYNLRGSAGSDNPLVQRVRQAFQA